MKTARKLEAEIKLIAAREELTRKQSDELLKATEEQKSMSGLLKEIHLAQVSNKQISTTEDKGKTPREEKDREEITTDDTEGWKVVERRKRAKQYRVYVESKGREGLPESKIRTKIEEIIQKENMCLKSIQRTTSRSK